MYLSVAVALKASENEPVLFRGDILKSADKARKIGYDAIEIHIKDVSQIDVESLLQYCKTYNFRVSAFATGMAKRIDGLSFIDDDAHVRYKAVERVKQFINVAELFNAGVIVGSLRGSIPAKQGKEKYLEQFLDCMDILAKYAEQKKVNILLEVINRYENNYLNTAQETLDIIKTIGSDFVKVHLDTFHMNIEETNMIKAIESCGEHLGYIHIADNTRLAVGTGTVNFGAVVDAANKIGYKEALSLECLPIPSGEIAAKNSFNKMSKLLYGGAH